MEYVKHKINYLAYIISVLLLILPVADIYASSWFSSLSTAICILLLYPLALLYCSKKRKIIISVEFRQYVYVALYITFISLFHGSFGNTEIFFLLGVFFYFCVTTSKDICQPFIKVYLVFSLLFSVFLIIQFVGLFFFSYPIEGLISFLPRNIQVESSIRESIFYSRISSVFTEPSHFALYVVPCAGILLFNVVSSVKYRKIKLGIIIASVILSTSGNGLMLLAILVCLYFFNLMKRKKYKVNAFATILVLMASLYFIVTTEFVQHTTENLFVSQTTDQSKADYRIYRGFMLYGEMPIDAKIFGCGWGNTEKYLSTSNPGLLAKYREGDVRFDYFNSIAGFLIYTGIIGSSLFFYFLYLVYKRCKMNEAKALFWTTVATLFSSSLFMSAQWQIYLLYIFTLININSLKNEGFYSTNKKHNDNGLLL